MIVALGLIFFKIWRMLPHGAGEIMMRAVFCVATVVMTMFGSSVFAQSPLEGPLAVPDSASATKPVKAKPNRHKATRTAHRADPEADEAGYGPHPTSDQPVARGANSKLPNDPMSFGMKWNGSNDSARETREQNYDGSAQGSGAEVGMKLHF